MDNIGFHAAVAVAGRALSEEVKRTFSRNGARVRFWPTKRC